MCAFSRTQFVMIGRFQQVITAIVATWIIEPYVAYFPCFSVYLFSQELNIPVFSPEESD